MSEHIKHHHESHESHEQYEHQPAAEAQPKPEAVAEKSAAEEAKKLEAIQKTIEQQAMSAHEVSVGQQEKEAPSQIGVNRELKQAAFDRLIARTRKKLSAPNRLLSDVIHQPAVDSVSRGAEKTVARPLPLLSAGIFAFAGSTVVLYLAKHYGFRYNLGIFFALLLVGFGVGLVIDLIKVALSRRQSV